MIIRALFFNHRHMGNYLPYLRTVIVVIAGSGQELAVTPARLALFPHRLLHRQQFVNGFLIVFEWREACF